MTTRVRSLEPATFSDYGSIFRLFSFVLDTPATALDIPEQWHAWTIGSYGVRPGKT